MSTNDPSPPRRSGRERKKPTSEYDQELEAIAKKKKPKRVTENVSSESESDDEEDLPLKLDSDIDSDMSEAEVENDDRSEDGTQSKTKKSKRGSSKPPPKKGRSIQVKTRGARKRTKAPRGGKQTGALNKIAKNVLDKSETPKTSLVAALLASSKPIPGINSVNISNSSRNSQKTETTAYTPQLIGVARYLLKNHESNSLHIELLNLLFRSVGGSVDTNLKPGTDLEELNDEEWDATVTEVVEVMRESEVECLLSATPEEKVVVQEYRAISKEFWYRLGNAILTHSQQQMSFDETDSQEESDKPQPFSSSLFQVEMMNNLVARITEVVQVGQPDLRYGATVAIWELACACMERSVELEQKIQVATRQYKAAKGQSKKMEGIKLSMDSWKRHKAELEEIVQTAVFQGVFINRYRDSNPNIRICAMEFLSRLTLLRPDLFLENKFLKYFGWMASDKEAAVRVAALNGLNGPFRHAKRETSNKKTSLHVNVEDMESVCLKFLTRIVDCTEDAESVQVQEAAMELIYSMLTNEFLDEWDDDDGWDQVNLKALDQDTSDDVRKNALYFCLDQMDPFDVDGEGNDGRSTMSHGLGEKQQVEQIEAIASWIANKLVDGPIELSAVRVERADFVIDSLREMKEHKHLAVNWSAMLKAIRSENPQQGRNTGREEAVKQRVLLRMFAHAAEKEVSSVEPIARKGGGKKRKRSSNTHPADALSAALLKTLPQLLTAYKGDVVALRSLTMLPQYLMPSVFGLPARKTEFLALIKNLNRLFQDSTDEIILQNVAHGLLTLSEGGHVRVGDVKMQIKRLSMGLQDRLMQLLRSTDQDESEEGALSQSQSQRSKSSKSKSSRRSRKSSGSESTRSTVGTMSPEAEMENSLSLCLLRWRVLLKLCPVGLLFGDSSNDDDESEVEEFYNTISEAMAKRLQDRRPSTNTGGSDDEMEVRSTWKDSDIDIHAEVGSSVNNSLQVLLTIVGWTLVETIQKHYIEEDDMEEGDMEVDEEDLAVVLRMRDRFTKLVGLCFDQYVDESEGVVYSDAQIEFAKMVQAAAAKASCDVRCLFPRHWADAKEGSLRSRLALVTDTQLIGGCVRYLHQREEELLAGVLDEDEASHINNLAVDLVVPIARALTANWIDGNRKEAGTLLAYIVGHSKTTGQVVQDVAKLMKKINPVRYLEAQMACLRMGFNKWLDGEPEISDHPSEADEEAYNEARELHEEMFQEIEQQARLLSRSLGVGKLRDASLLRALTSFMKEGVRFAFDGDDGVDDDMVLGSRFPFLLILRKYSNWAKKNKYGLEDLKQFILEKEEVLMSHPEFNDVHEDDLKALAAFKESLGMEVEVAQVVSQDDESSEDERSTVGTPSPSKSSTASSRRRISTAGSQRSRLSTQSNLSPLEEEEGDSDEEETSPSPSKRSKVARSKIEEEDEESDAESEES